MGDMGYGKVLIVGGGASGLSAGIYLARRGIRTVIFEKNSTVGGCLEGWQRRGYHIDNCIHWLTGTRKGTALYQMWEELGALGDSVPIFHPEALYASESESGRLCFSRSPERLSEEIASLFPDDYARLRGFIRSAEAIASATMGKDGLRNAARCAAALLEYMPKSLNRLAESVSHPLLASALTDYIGGEFTAYGLLRTYADFIAGNADIPKGGSVAMAKRMEKRYRNLGGEIRTFSEADSLLYKDGRAYGIRLTNGECESGFAVICACDPAVTFGKLLPAESIPPRLLRYYSHRKEYPVFSAFQTAIGVSGDLPFHTTTAFPVKPFLSDGRTHNRLTVRPFSHEPDFAPKGHSLMQIMVFQHENACRTWISLRNSDRERYAERKRELSESLMSRVTDAYPELKGRCEIIDTWTPATYHRYHNAFYGAFMSFALTGKGIPTRVFPTVTGFSNVYLATQWCAPPGGLPNAAMAGKNAADRLIFDLAEM